MTRHYKLSVSSGGSLADHAHDDSALRQARSSICERYSSDWVAVGNVRTAAAEELREVGKAPDDSFVSLAAQNMSFMSTTTLAMDSFTQPTASAFAPSAALPPSVQTLPPDSLIETAPLHRASTATLPIVASGASSVEFPTTSSATPLLCDPRRAYRDGLVKGRHESSGALCNIATPCRGTRAHMLPPFVPAREFSHGSTTAPTATDRIASVSDLSDAAGSTSPRETLASGVAPPIVDHIEHASPAVSARMTSAYVHRASGDRIKDSCSDYANAMAHSFSSFPLLFCSGTFMGGVMFRMLCQPVCSLFFSATTCVLLTHVGRSAQFRIRALK